MASPLEHRIRGFDMLRALAVFLVLAYHTAYRFVPEKSDVLAQSFKHSGWIGVDMFFVISGYMITRILLRDFYSKNVQGFFIRRAFRILPLLMVAVSIFLVGSLLTGRDAENLPLIWSPALLLNGWTIPFLGYERVPYTITWSLSVEETAYVLLGAASFLGFAGIRLMLFGLLFVSIFTRAFVMVTGALDFFDLFFFVPARLDGIALGGLAALGLFDRVVRYRVTRWFTALSTLTLVWVYQYTPLQSPFMPLAGYTLFALSCSLWVACIGLSVKKVAASKPNWFVSGLVATTASFGKLSYFIYLFHMFVLEGIRFMTTSGLAPALTYWQALLAASFVTYAVAVLSWRFLEAPLIQKGRLLAERRLRVEHCAQINSR
jgi:peptidoglycan/LPS O-acetylase OafA/YrhL